MFKKSTVICMLAGFLACSPAFADWPNKPVRIIVPFAAGGSTDLIARQIAQELQKVSPYSVIVENKAGAGGTLGGKYVRTQPVDGHTLLLGTVSTHSISPAIYSRMPYDPLKDFEPLVMIGSTPLLVLVNPSKVKAKSLQDFAAQYRPSDLSYGSSGTGTFNHLAAASLMNIMKMQTVHIPYKGSSPALIDAVAGNVEMTLDVVLTAQPYVNGGQLRALAITSSARSPLLPNVPTVAESGYPNFEAVGWFGLFASTGMSRDDARSAAVKLSAVIRGDTVHGYLVKQGVLSSDLTGQEFLDSIERDTTRWVSVARAAGVQPE